MKHLKHCITAYIVVLFCCAGFDIQAADKPNILIIVSDDQGYADAGFQGSKEAITPNLDALAKAGVRCTSGYVTHPFCSPTRAGLLTGRYQQRFGHEHNPVYDPLDEKEGLPLTEKLLPEYMKTAGYVTGWVGKWHLGSSPKHAPWQRGFGETFGFIGGGHRFLGWVPNGRQYTLPLLQKGEETKDVPPHLTAAFGNEAARFIRSNKEKSWMLYMAFNAPHTPHEPTPDRLEKFAHITNPARRKYLAQVSLMDDAIGTMMAALNESGQAKNTLVFFFSDNGGPVQNGAVNTPLRGTKGQVYDGGVRVPFLISWPGKLPAGATYDSPVSSLDVLATAMAISGQQMPVDKKYDGVNLIPYLIGENKESPHEYLYWRNGKKMHAVRNGNWKLVRLANQPIGLYDLSTDIAESKNLATEKPEIATKLIAALDAWDKELIDPVFPGSTVKNEDWGPGGVNQKNNK